MRKWMEWLLVCCVLTVVLIVLIPHLPAALRKVGLFTFASSFVTVFAYLKLFEYFALTSKRIAAIASFVLLLTMHVGSTYERYRIWFADTLAQAKSDPLTELALNIANSQAAHSKESAELAATLQPSFHRFLSWRYSNIGTIQEEMAVVLWGVEILSASAIASVILLRPWKTDPESERDRPQTVDREVSA